VFHWVYAEVICGSYEETSTAARDRFGGQKGISSDMYFERGSYDPVATSEAQERLRSFQGATSISSNAYFGREEEEGPDGEGAGASGDGMFNDGSLANLEANARDAIQRVMANPDVQNAAESIRQGALKVCSRFVIMKTGKLIIVFQLSDYLAQLSADR
jgi:ADP-ribosylation factor GTPase-activating protein 2/3